MQSHSLQKKHITEINQNNAWALMFWFEQKKHKFNEIVYPHASNFNLFQAFKMSAFSYNLDEKTKISGIIGISSSLDFVSVLRNWCHFHSFIS